MTHTQQVLLFALFMLPGLAGVLLPGVPGVPLMFAVAVGYGWIDGFRHLTYLELAGLFVVMLAAVAADYVFGLLGARYGGASRASLVFGFVGLVAGTILLPPFGGIVGMFVAVLAVELGRHRDRNRALKAATGSAVGTVAGMAASLALAAFFLVLFVVLAWR